MISHINHKIGRYVFRASFGTRSSSSTQFVPEHDPVREDDIVRLEKFLSDKPNILVLTGAGISTESGR